MKKISAKILFIILIFFIIVFSFINIFSVYGFDISDLSGTKASNTQLDGVINTIVTIVSTIGSIISVIVIIILGIKYMVGSTEERAQFKQSMMPYLVGAIIVFAASTIVGIIYNAIVKGL